MQREEIILPAKGSIVLGHQKGTKKFRFFVKVVNKTLIFLYRIYLLPIVGIGKYLILLETIGRKTGKKHCTPVLCRKFYTEKLTLYSARGQKSDWLKNILHTKEHIVNIQKGFKKFQAKAELIEEEEEKIKHLRYFFEHFKDAKQIFGYNKKKHKDIFELKQFSDLVKIIEFIQLEEV
ncbi:MAG: nitroreductase/quinone reductase family protein [Candidatus Heimdallarchaeaceae archaeon]